MSEDFVVKAAVRVNTPAFIALAGPSGSGKTRSALELATGLAGDGKILLADTEGNRALHYADLYKFDHVEFRPPYTPERCAALIDLAEKLGYAAVIVDSASDEFEGEGGLQEIKEATKDEFWAKTKARHKHALINRIRRSRVHSIWCLRCEERVRIENVNGRTVVIPLGWQPICEKRFLYEMQSSFRFDPDHPGCPVPIKLYDIHARFFPAATPITRDAGRQLAEWCAGPVVREQQEATARDEDSILSLAEGKAGEGREALKAWWGSITRDNRQRLAADLDHLKEIAADADAARNPAATAGPTEQTADPAETPRGDAREEVMPHSDPPSHNATAPATTAGADLSPDAAELDGQLRATAEAGLQGLYKLWHKQPDTIKAELRPFYADYEGIARRRIAETP